MTERGISPEQSRAREQASRRSLETHRNGPNWMTQDTHDRLTSELENYRLRAIDAREEGDINEHLQSRAKVEEVTEILKKSRIISTRLQTDKIKLGNSFLYKFEGDETISEAHMVGRYDVGVSYMHPGQPIADAVMERRAGETVSFVGGDKKHHSVEIVQILPGSFDKPKESL
ncbi:MAG TPA: hypothetical protein VES68_03100 [Candidatus Sulfotelmatobacter sp.]|nr:hypothetical protein [Candidatus Sulfotelmatobacter sp.]